MASIIRSFRLVSRVQPIFHQLTARSTAACLHTLQNRQTSLHPVSFTSVEQPTRHYSSGKKLTDAEIEAKIFKVCKAFDKINPDKLTVESHFMKDLGLDSLDHVEVVMAMEDEFGFEIPDADAEKLLRVADLIRYVADKHDVYE